jgi:Baculovirus F protein
MATKTALISASKSVWRKASKKLPEFTIRQPRGAISLALGALGTFMGLYNSYQIRSLKKELEQSKEAHNRLVEVVQTHARYIEELQNTTDYLKETIRINRQFNVASIARLLSDLEDNLRQRLNKVTHVIQIAQTHRLAIDFLPASQLPKLFERLTNQAKAMDHQLIVKKPSDLFQLELSYFYDGENMQMLLHVPSVPKDSILRLLKLHPFPLPLSKNYSVVPNVQDDLLAISAGFNRYSAQLSSVDLLGCHAINNIYLCERHGVLGKQLNNSCLGALYLQDFELVQSLCPLFIRPAGEVVRQLLDNWFLIFSPNPQTAYISCRNGTENEAYIKSGITRTFLSPGCKMNLNLHLLQADFSLNLPEDIIHFSWDWDTSKVTPNLDNYMKTLFDKGNPNPTLRDLNELKLQELRTRDSKETRIRDMQKFIHLENEIELLRESKTPDLNELKVKTKRPQKAVANIFIAFILSIVALALIALLILWQCGKDFLFKYTFFQRFMHPALRHALQLLSQLRESRQPHPQHPPPRAPPENPDTAMAVYQPFVTQSHPPRPSVRVIPASPPPGYQQPRGLPITPNVYRRYPDLSQAEYNPYALVANPPV